VTATKRPSGPTLPGSADRPAEDVPGGRRQPFERVVAAHGDTVLRVCRAVLPRCDADDAWSETFLSAMRAYPDLPVDANVRAWLVTIAHRKAIDVTRSSARRALPVAVVPDGAPPPGRAADQGLDLDGGLLAALDALPPKQKRAVAYHYLAGLPYAEVAVIVGGTPEAARRAAADGIAALRRATSAAAPTPAAAIPVATTATNAAPNAATPQEENR
jgi:RNA polymerase sigma factor (sigma-70 family)